MTFSNNASPIEYIFYILYYTCTMRKSMQSNEFEPLERITWLTTPGELGEYTLKAYKRQRQIAKLGSLAPLAIARVVFTDLTDPTLIANFTDATGIAARSASPVTALKTSRTRVQAAQDRPTSGWHVDHQLAPIPGTQSLRFIFSATHDPELTTRFAQEGSPVVTPQYLRHPLQVIRACQQETPPDDAIVQAEGDIIYAITLDQTLHASPTKPTHDDAVFMSRFAHFIARE